MMETRMVRTGEDNTPGRRQALKTSQLLQVSRERKQGHVSEQHHHSRHNDIVHVTTTLLVALLAADNTSCSHLTINN